MDTITPLSSILPVGASASQGRGRSHSHQPPAAGLMFKATVLEALGNNRFSLDIAGNRFNASSEAQLIQGETLQLQVTQTEPHIELRIVADTANLFAGRSLTLLGKSIDLSALLASLKGHNPPPLQMLTPTSRNVLEGFYSLQQQDIGTEDGGAILKQLIDNLGLSLEHMLANGDKDAAVHTLKAALLEMAHSFAFAEQIAEHTHKVLTTIELFQLAQLQTGSESQKIFPLPLPFVDQGYLIVENQRQGSESSGHDVRESRFSLHLTMSDLGNLRIDFSLNPAGLFIRFHADSQETAEFIAAHAEDLQQAVTNTPHMSLAFSGDATDPINDLIRSIIPQGIAMLDTKV